MDYSSAFNFASSGMSHETLLAAANYPTAPIVGLDGADLFQLSDISALVLQFLDKPHPPLK